MNQELFDRYFSRIIQSIDQLQLPIALVDDSLCLIWANPYLRTNFPYLTAPDSVTTLLEGYQLQTIVNDLRASPLAHSYSCTLPLISAVLDLSPVFDQREQLLGGLVHFSVASSKVPIPGLQNMQTTDQILSNFSTSLRNPLSSSFATLTAMSGRLDLGDLPNCQLLLNQLNRNLYGILKSCTSITEYSRYANSLAYLRLVEVDFVSFMKEILLTARSLLCSAGIDLSFELPERSFPFCCDPDKLVIVLMSLLSNSAAFSDPEKGEAGTQIHLSVSVNDKRITLTILDHGIGIPESIFPHIFDPYFSHRSESSCFAGVGLGLPLSKLIVAHHGGMIAVQSEEGKGSSVAFSLSRELSTQDFSTLSLSNNAAVYVKNRFSPLYIFLCDLCECPEP